MMGQPTIHEGNPKILKQHDYASKLMFPFEEVYSSAQTLGVEKIDGIDCYKVELTPKEGRKEICYYDKETLLARRVELILDEPLSGQQLPIQITFGDYRDVNGVKHAFHSRIKVSMMEFEWVYQSIQHNVKIPDSTFALPAEVANKVKEKDSANAPKKEEK